MKTFLTSIFCVLFLQIGFPQEKKASQFLTKCLVSELNDKSNFDLPEWANQEDILSIGATQEIINVTSASKKWVKKKADRNCLSANPEDCLVWCLVEVPATFKTTITDWQNETQKSLLPESEMIQDLLKNGYFLDWKKALNPERLSNEASQKIISELKREGYLPKSFKGDFQTEVRFALFELQEDFGLPIGNLNFETLDFFEIEYEAFEINKKRKVSSNRFDKNRNASYYRSSSLDIPPNAEAGKCYAKCLIADVWGKETYELPVYVGLPDDKTVKRKRKKIGDRELMIVKKPKKVDPKFIEWKTISETKIIRKGGFTEWREILCAEKVTAYTIQQLQEALMAEGFLDLSYKEERIGGQTKEALKEFQRENALPVGNLDFETLDALGIDYY